MPTASSQALCVSPATVVRRKRRLPISGEILVQPGEQVPMDRIVARALVPGSLHPINAAGRLALPPTELLRALRVQAGDSVTRGQLLAETHSLFGLFKNSLSSPIDGTVDAISAVTGQLTLREKAEPLELPAYLPGEVVAIEAGTGVEIEARVCQVQGIVGLGGEAFGPLKQVGKKRDDVVVPSMISGSHNGAVLFTGGGVTLEALEAMMYRGVKAVVAASASGQDLMTLTNSTLNPAFTGNEQLGLTVVLTEGFGGIGMSDKSFEILSRLDGKNVSVSGRTQIRAGVIRPEVIAEPLLDIAATSSAKDHVTLGDPVRVIRGHAFGQIGAVKEIPPDLRTIGSSAKALVFLIELESGKELIVPRPNVEQIIG